MGSPPTSLPNAFSIHLREQEFSLLSKVAAADPPDIGHVVSFLCTRQPDGGVQAPIGTVLQRNGSAMRSHNAVRDDKRPRPAPPVSVLRRHSRISRGPSSAARGGAVAATCGTSSPREITQGACQPPHVEQAMPRTEASESPRTIRNTSSSGPNGRPLSPREATFRHWAGSLAGTARAIEMASSRGRRGRRGPARPWWPPGRHARSAPLQDPGSDLWSGLTTIPSVGPVVSLALTATIDIPARFRNAGSVGPALGLTPTLHQSGESSRIGRVSLCGDAMMRGLPMKRRKCS